MFKSVLKLTKPVTKFTQAAASCNYVHCCSIVIPKESTCNINQQLVRCFAKETKPKQPKKESKKKEKSLKSEVKADEKITKTSDLAKKKESNTEKSKKLSKKEEYERAVAAKKAKEQEMSKEKSKIENQEEKGEVNVTKEINKETVNMNQNVEIEKEFVPDINSWSKKILLANSLKPAIRILEEHQSEFPLNEIPYIIKTFGVYFSSAQSKQGYADIKNLNEFKSFSNFLDKYYENNFKDNNNTKYPISPTQMVDVLITLNRMSFTNHSLYNLLFNKIQTLTNSLTPSHLSKLLWLYASNKSSNYYHHQVTPVVRLLNDHFNELSEENLCRCLWSIAHLHRYDFQDILENGLNCLVKMNQAKQIDLHKLLSMLPEIPNRNTSSCRYFNALFRMLIPYNGQLSYSDAVTILHAYVNHSDDISFSTVRKYEDILHKPTPELENLLNQSFILASEHINEFNKSQLVEFSFYINHSKTAIPDHIMANVLKKTSEMIKDYGPAASLIALDLFGTHTKEFILDNLNVYSAVLEQVKSHFNVMSETQLNITIELFSVIHNMLREEDKILPTLIPILYKIITKPENNNYSTRLVGTYLRAVKNMGITKPSIEEMNQLLSQFIRQMSLDKTPGNDIMLILSFCYLENKELAIQILKFIERYVSDYTLNPLTAVSLLETCVKYDYPSTNIYKLCLACFICDPEAVQLEEFTSFCRCGLKMNITSNTFKKLLPVFEKSISSFKATSLVDILTYISTMSFSYPKVFNIAEEKIIRDKRCLKNAYNVLYSYYRQNVDEEVFKDIYNHFFNSIKTEELSENDKNFYDKVLCELYK